MPGREKIHRATRWPEVCYFPGGFIFAHEACSSDDCKASEVEVKEKQSGVREIMAGIVAKIKRILKEWFTNVLKFFNDMLDKAYKTVEDMFKSWKKDHIDQVPLNPLTVTKWAALLLLSSFTFSRCARCRFFWWWCEEIPTISEDPNKCPYQSWLQLFAHFKSQPQWIKWRAEKNLKTRASLGRKIVVYFHPDKCVDADLRCFENALLSHSTLTSQQAFSL